MPRGTLSVLLLLAALALVPFACVARARVLRSPLPRLHLVRLELDGDHVSPGGTCQLCQLFFRYAYTFILTDFLVSKFDIFHFTTS